jgi:hypothetical protein
MKLILSRKGFDSSYGGFPSPILPDGALCPLPIPSGGGVRLADVMWRGSPLSEVVSAITKRRIKAHTGVHLDPDLQCAARPRLLGWAPLFGQVGAAQSHLQSCGVGIGDLFLFFGWFRRTQSEHGNLAYDRAQPGHHVIFGWLQVGEILYPTNDPSSIPSWAAGHPHVQHAAWMVANNTVYVAARQLHFDGVASDLAGAGVFPTHTPALMLTAPGKRRSLWRLPRWMYPSAGKPPLSYHSDRRRWKRDATGCFLQTVGRGQEFVLDCERYPEAHGWLADLFANMGSRSAVERWPRQRRRQSAVTGRPLDGPAAGLAEDPRSRA